MLSRPCMGPTLQRRFSQLRAMVSPTLLAPALPHDDLCILLSSQPSTSHSSRPPADDPNQAFDPKAETINQEGKNEEVKDRERTNPHTPGSPAVSAALAAPLLLAALAVQTVQSAAAAAPAARKVRSRPFRIPRT